LEAARQSLDVEWTETFAGADAAGDHDVMGYPSTVAYLKHRMNMAGGRAHRYVRNARMALLHRATFSAWKHRQISGDEAELMFQAAERMPDKYSDAESILLELAGDSVDETRRVLDYWRKRCRPAWCGLGCRGSAETPLLRADPEEQWDGGRPVRITRPGG
jgi:hypothetical protein